MTKFLNISTDTTLGGNSPSDETVSSQKALKTYIDAHSGGGGSADIDNQTITKNSDDKLQAVALIDQHSGFSPKKIWTGTRAQYDAIATKSSLTLYNITDDTDVTLTILEALYPVGSVYLTTAAACPLATLGVGTWTLRSTSVITAVSSASTAPVKGTGKTLGLYDGTNGYGLIGAASNVAGDLRSYTGLYDKNVGGTGITGTVSSGKHLGITTDAANSGIIADTSNVLNSSSYTVNIFERTA